jgi:hypothetical protein
MLTTAGVFLSSWLILSNPTRNLTVKCHQHAGSAWGREILRKVARSTALVREKAV